MSSAARPTPSTSLSGDDTGVGVGTPVVVVGVDGSAAAHQALLFAAREAQLRQALLRIVAAHDLSAAVYGYGYPLGLTSGPFEDGLRQAAETMVKAAADTVATAVDRTARARPRTRSCAEGARARFCSRPPRARRCWSSGLAAPACGRA